MLDTNFLISKLGYLDTVLTLADQRPGSLLVLLPWVVIRELDGLKVKPIFYKKFESKIFTKLILRLQETVIQNQKFVYEQERQCVSLSYVYEKRVYHYEVKK